MFKLEELFLKEKHNNNDNKMDERIVFLRIQSISFFAQHQCKRKRNGLTFFISEIVDLLEKFMISVAKMTIENFMETKPCRIIFE